MISFSIELNKKDKNALSKVFKKVNTERFEKFLLAKAAEMLYSELKDRLDVEGESVRNFVDNLAIGYIDDYVGVFVNKKGVINSGLVDVSTNALFFMPNKDIVENPSVVLSKYNPWIASKIPWKPEKDMAKIMIRKIRIDEYKAIEFKNDLDAEKTKSELKRDYDIRDFSGKIKLEEFDIYEDLGWLGRRMEYGYDGFKNKNIWKNSVKHVVENIVKKHKDDLEDIVFKGEKKSYDKATLLIKTDDLKGIKDFVKHI